MIDISDYDPGEDICEEEFLDYENGCYFCSDDFHHYDPNNCIYEEDDGTFTLVLESGEWDEYGDTFMSVYVHDVKNCLKCGRKLA